MPVLAESRRAPDGADVPQLRAELERLAAENAALRAQIAHTTTARRRWIGRLATSAVLALGFALGVWYTGSFGRAVAAALHQFHQADVRKEGGDGKARAHSGRAEREVAVPRSRP